MAENDDKPRDVAPPQGPLLTREVFLDTEAYRRVGFDVTRPSIAALISHVANERLELHTTDITLQEIKRQIAVEADKVVDEIRRARRTHHAFSCRCSLTRSASLNFKRSNDSSCGALPYTIL